MRAYRLCAQSFLGMWRFPQRLWIVSVTDRVALFVGDEWERCEWCFERMGVPARHETGGWLFVCPVCAEPWLSVTNGPGLRAAGGGPGEPWWFREFSGGGNGPRECSSGWGGFSMSVGSEVGGFIRLGSVFAWVHIGNRRARGIRLEAPEYRPRSWRLVRALTMMNPQDGGVAGGVGVAERDRTWDNSDEAIQLQNALRDDGRRHGGERRWLNLGDLIDGYRRLGAFSFDDLWSAAGLAHRHGSRRFECFWQRTPGGGWDVWVLLREEHLPNREGR